MWILILNSWSQNWTFKLWKLKKYLNSFKKAQKIESSSYQTFRFKA